MCGTPAHAQNSIASGDWEGFATRTPEDKFDRCVLYNRKIALLNASPHDMIGLTRNAEGHVGIMVFYQPRALTRAEQATVTLRIDGGAPIALPAEIPSDFHAIAGPLPTAVLTALRAAKAIEAGTESRTLKVTVSGVGEVLDALETCVTANATKPLQ